MVVRLQLGVTAVNSDCTTWQTQRCRFVSLTHPVILCGRSVPDIKAGPESCVDERQWGNSASQGEYTAEVDALCTRRAWTSVRDSRSSEQR
jgi:hypothetical protein